MSITSLFELRCESEWWGRIFLYEGIIRQWLSRGWCCWVISVKEKNYQIMRTEPVPTYQIVNYNYQFPDRHLIYKYFYSLSLGKFLWDLKAQTSWHGRWKFLSYTWKFSSSILLFTVLQWWHWAVVSRIYGCQVLAESPHPNPKFILCLRNYPSVPPWGLGQSRLPDYSRDKWNFLPGTQK